MPKHLIKCFSFAGLIGADWGGTPIEAWSPGSAINMCGSSIRDNCIKENEKESQEQFCDSAMWNAMVNPLKWNSVKVCFF